MSRVLAILCVVIESAVASAQPAPPPDEPQPPSEASPPPEVEPPPLPPPPQPPPPQPPPPDPYDACKRARHDIRVHAEAIANSDARGRLLLEMPDCGHFDPAAFAKLQASWPQDPVSSLEQPPYHHTGFAFGVELEVAEGAPSTHVFVGSQGTTALLGLALDLEHVSQPGMAPSATTVLIGPALGLTLARSETGRSEILLGIAASYQLFDQISALDHQIIGRIGPSLRYWLTPSFAAAVTANARYDRLSFNTGESQNVVSIGSALDLVAVF